MNPTLGEAWSASSRGGPTEMERNYDLFEVMHLPLFPWHAAPKHHFVRIEPSSGERSPFAGHRQEQLGILPARHKPPRNEARPRFTTAELSIRDGHAP